MKRIIVFRFDRNPRVCRSRVAHLRSLNPDVPICGLFGGDKGLKRAAFRFVGRQYLRLDSLYCSERSGRWNWKNGDLALGAWYRDVGSRMDFEVAHLIEWDILLLDSLERLYASVPAGAVGLTAPTPVSEVEHDWEWMQRADYRREWADLLQYVRERWSYNDTPYACLFPGACFPRRFLARYAALDPPDLCHDELRLPLLAQAMGFPIADTGFRHRWHGTEDERFFNVHGGGIQLTTIIEELAREDGRRAFHPFTAVFDGYRPR